MKDGFGKSVNGRRRAGIAVVWIILATPALVAALIVVIDYANVWAARCELEAALEAAAQAGVDAWADESRADDHADPDGDVVEGGELKTDVARRAARAAALANLVRGQPVDLDLNDNGASPGTLSHDNQSCDGDILLGGYDDDTFTFVQNSDVGCGRTEITVVELALNIFVEVNTSALNSTALDPNAFRVRLENPAGSTFTGSVTQITVLLRNPDVEFAGPNQPEVGAPNPPGMDGVFQPEGAAPPSEANGYGPEALTPDGPGGVLNEVAGVTFDETNVANGILVVNIPAGNFTTDDDKNELYFGVDTDGVGDGTPASSPVDRGRDFGDTGAASGRNGRVAFVIGVNGVEPVDAPKIQSLQPQGQDIADLQGNAFNLQGQVEFVTVVDNNDFAVLCRKTMQVPSLWNSVFGLSVGPHRISARATATSRCSGSLATPPDAEDPDVEDPQLAPVPVGNVSCPGPTPTP